MPDDLSPRRSMTVDATMVDPSSPEEHQYWKLRHNATPEELQEVIQLVGTRAVDIDQEFHRRRRTREASNS